MDIGKALLKEHSKKQSNRIVKYVGNDGKRFSELMRLFLHGDYRLTQRAAWPLSYIVIANPGLIKPYFKALIDNFEKTKVPDAVIRNTVRILQCIPIPKRFHGKVMKACFGFIQSNTTPAAIKAFSLTVLEKLAKIYPEILRELQLIIEERWPIEKPAFRSRARKIMGRSVILN